LGAPLCLLGICVLRRGGRTDLRRMSSSCAPVTGAAVVHRLFRAVTIAVDLLCANWQVDSAIAPFEGRTYMPPIARPTIVGPVGRTLYRPGIDGSLFTRRQAHASARSDCPQETDRAHIRSR
jgi:hypothetical protein